MLEGKTKSGFEFKIRDEATDDWELLEALAKVDRGDITFLIDAANMLLGEEQMSELKKHCKTNGRISAEKMFEEITDILKYGEKPKNS